MVLTGQDIVYENSVNKKKLFYCSQKISFTFYSTKPPDCFGCVPLCGMRLGISDGWFYLGQDFLRLVYVEWDLGNKGMNFAKKHYKRCPNQPA